MNSPTFFLPPCPACSTIFALERPTWHAARMVSAKRGQPTFSFLGCRHAKEVGKGEFYSDPQDWAKIEADWKEVCDLLFDFKTQAWSDEQRERFRKKLDDRVELLPAEVEEIPPEQTKATKPEDEEPAF